MKKLFVIVYCILLTWACQAQNLVPNGSFEKYNTFEYTDPQSAFLNLENWYPANKFTIPTIGNGTPDLFDARMSIPPSNNLNFWNSARGAAQGDLHAGIANNFLLEGYTAPEAFGTALTEPLEAGFYYHVSLQFRNKGISGYLSDPILCVPESYKQLTLMLDKDSVFVTIDEINKDSYSDASQQINLQSPIMESTIIGNWYPLGTCFQAAGGERFLTTTLTNGRFTVDPPCKIEEEHWDVFYVYYFDIDDINLVRLPEVINVTESICTNRPKRINIADLANLPIMQNEIEYRWEDGTIDSINYIAQTGTYRIEAVLDCTTIPIILQVEGTSCETAAYVPTAFSPNDDGQNDLMRIFITDNLPIETYRFTVYNRWGKQVFTTDSVAKSWDGTAQGSPLSADTYIWVLNYSTLDPQIGNVTYQQSGSVVLIR